MVRVVCERPVTGSSYSIMATISRSVYRRLRTSDHHTLFRNNVTRQHTDHNTIAVHNDSALERNSSMTGKKSLFKSRVSCVCVSVCRQTDDNDRLQYNCSIANKRECTGSVDCVNSSGCSSCSVSHECHTCHFQVQLAAATVRPVRQRFSIPVSQARLHNHSHSSNCSCSHLAIAVNS